MRLPLKDEVEMVCSQLAENIFAKEGEVCSVYFLTLEDESVHALPPFPPNMPKEVEMAIVRHLIRTNDAVRCIRLGECWMSPRKLSEADAQEVFSGKKRVSEMPDRREVIMAIGEDRDGGISTCHREIIRDDSKATLGKVEMIEFDSLGGRMAGFFTSQSNPS